MNLDNVTHMMGDDNIGTTILFFGSADKRVEILDIPEYLLSEAADTYSRELIQYKMTPNEEEYSD